MVSCVKIALIDITFLPKKFVKDLYSCAYVMHKGRFIKTESKNHYKSRNIFTAKNIPFFFEVLSLGRYAIVPSFNLDPRRILVHHTLQNK